MAIISRTTRLTWLKTIGPTPESVPPGRLADKADAAEAVSKGDPLPEGTGPRAEQANSDCKSLVSYRLRATADLAGWRRRPISASWAGW